MTANELAHYRRVGEETDRELGTPAGEKRLRRMALRRLARSGPIHFPIEIVERSGRLVGTVPDLPVRVVAASERALRSGIVRRLNELAATDPFSILRSVEAWRRATLTIEFKAPRVG